MRKTDYDRITYTDKNIKVYEKKKNGKKIYAVEFGIYSKDKLGKNHRRSKTTGFKFASTDEARRYAEKSISGAPLVSLAIEEKAQSTTIGELFELYRKHIRELPIEQMAPSTKRDYREKLNTLEKYSGGDKTKSNDFNILNFKISQLTNNETQVWLNHLKNEVKTKKGKLMASRYYQKHKFYAKSMLVWANDNNFFYMATDRFNQIMSVFENDVNPVVPKEAIKKKQSKRKVSLQEFNDLMEPLKKTTFSGYNIDNEPIIYFIDNSGKINIDYKYYVLYSIMFYAGLRTEEAKALTIDDVLFNIGVSGRLRVDKAITRHDKEDEEEYYKELPTKNHESVRFVPMKPELRHILKQYCELYEKYHCRERFDGVLMPGAKGKYMSDNAIGSKLDTLKKQIGMTKGFSKHDLRKSCATHLCYELKLDYADIFPFFGWESEKMLREVYDQMDNIQDVEFIEHKLSKSGFFDTEELLQAKERGTEHTFKEQRNTTVNWYSNSNLNSQFNGKK